MSDSYPTIQDALSDVQKDFMGCVEMHLDPPATDDPSYTVEATYRFADPDDAALPGESVRFSLAVDEDDEEDLTERRHVIEFIDADGDRPRGWIRHRMKRVEVQNGRFFWTESRFEVGAPGFPEGQARQADVELEVKSLVDKIRMLDRARKLAEI